MNANRSSDPLTEATLHGSAVYLAGVCFVASIGGLLFGFDTAVISGTFTFVEEQFGLTELQVGWFASSALFGCIFGALVAGALGDKWGRRPILIVAAVLFFVSAFLSAILPSYGMHVGFLTFAAICLVATIFFWRLVPETKGKSLEEIEKHWLDLVAITASKKTPANSPCG